MNAQTIENIREMSDQEMKSWIHRSLFGTQYRPADLRPSKSFTEWALENNIPVSLDDANLLMTEHHEKNPLF